MSEAYEHPTVSVIIPTFNEEGHIDATLDSVARQDYPNIVEVLVVDGRSTDSTRELVVRRGDAEVLDNPQRMQAAALNVGLGTAAGNIVVRVDGHCLLAPDYVSACVASLESTGAAMVGGAMTPVADEWLQRGIAEAMQSRIGAGPARFHVGGPSGWVDTVYLGAYRTDLAREVGGYSTEVGVNEDSEFAHRMGQHGGVWFDPAIRSTYVPRATFAQVQRQFWRYGLSRAATARRHPSSLSARQFAVPALFVALLSPWRRWAALAYVGTVAAASAKTAVRTGPGEAFAFAVTVPVMHVAWGAGFLAGLSGLVEPPRPVVVTELPSEGAGA